MKLAHFRRSQLLLSACVVLLLAPMKIKAQGNPISVGGGSLSYATSTSTGNTTCFTAGGPQTVSYTTTTFNDFAFTINGVITPLDGETYSSFLPTKASCDPIPEGPTTITLGLPNGNPSNLNFSISPGRFPTGTASVNFTVNPAYKVTSILYSPPGNQSTQSYTNTSTTGTISSISSSFTQAYEFTFSSGLKTDAISIGGTAFWGFSVGSTSNHTFAQTWSDALGYGSDDNSSSTYNPTGSDSANHNLDTFYIWLNPEVSGTEGAVSSTYTVTSQPIPGVSATIADTVAVPAITLEPAPAGMTVLNPTGTAGVSTVPLSILVPQAIPNDQGTGNSYMPGLAAICKDQSLYSQQLANPTQVVCTQANQCGCTPDDFAGILATDPLLNYSSVTGTVNPYPDTVSPLSLDGSGSSVCGQNPIPAGSDCRYVIVPISAGSTTPQFLPLTGSGSNTYQQTDSTTSSLSTGATTSYNTGFSFGGGSLLASANFKATWTWTDSESTGTTNGSANSLAILLKTSTASCNQNVNVFEDTVYHTFAFQVPTGNFGCK